MDKLKMYTSDKTEENFKKLSELFPDAVTETKDEDGNVVRAIDKDVLMQEISAQVVEGKQERYQFTWPDKKKSVVLANQPINKTLRLDRKKSVGRDGTPGSIDTENVYIEGDNLDVLKLLQETYLGKVKMIYIDPPYNTGNDFIYEDDFSQDLDDYANNSGQTDDEGNRLVQNTESNGRFHTNWLKMLYPRLKLAKDLLADNGAIFISIDDNEQTNIKNICNEIFGEKNKIAEFVIIRAEGGGMAKQVIKGHEYLFVYAKSMCSFTPLGKQKDVRGKILEKNGEKYWVQEDWLRKEFGKYGNCHYEEILEYKGKSKLDEINRGLAEGKYILIPKNNGMNIVGKLRNLKDDSSKFYSVLKHLSANGIVDLKNLELAGYFDYPKPVSLIKEIISGMTFFTQRNSDIVLDFFSGSATTAHATMQLNAEDGGNRKFIMVQLPEQTDEKDEAYKAGYMNICEIGKERIRRAGEKIKEENKDKENIENLDIGFKVLKLDTSNIRKWQPDYDNLEQSLLDYVDNYMEGRTELDVVYEIILKYGLDLTYPVDEFTLAQKKVYSIGFGMLMICLDDEITTEVAKGILEKVKELAPESTRVVFKDNGFKTDSNKTNIKEILKCGGIEEFITL